MLPFTEVKKNGKRIRIFSQDVDSDDLIWHRDDEERVIRVLEASNWYFQREDELPFEIRPGDEIIVPRHQWHRVIRRGSDRLVVEIIIA